MFLRSPSATSPAMGAVSFSIGTLSPVRALSAHFRLAASSRRPSAQTESPASSTTTSPTVTSRPGTRCTRPSRSTLAVGTAICLRLSSEAVALTVCTVPRTAFRVMTARITTALSQSPKKEEIPAARIRINTRTSRNCSKKMRGTLFFPTACSSLGPYRFTRSAASVAVNPSAPQFSSWNSSCRSFCQICFPIDAILSAAGHSPFPPEYPMLLYPRRVRSIPLRRRKFTFAPAAFPHCKGTGGMVQWSGEG